MKSKRVKINVTKSCIKKGRPGNIFSCPIALAALNVGLQGVSVHSGSIFFKRASSEREFLPAKALRFITRFDGKKSVKPFSFMVKI